MRRKNCSSVDGALSVCLLATRTALTRRSISAAAEAITAGLKLLRRARSTQLLAKIMSSAESISALKWKVRPSRDCRVMNSPASPQKRASSFWPSLSVQTCQIGARSPSAATGAAGGVTTLMTGSDFLASFLASFLGAAWTIRPRQRQANKARGRMGVFTDYRTPPAD